jgi:hypothetical protein
MSCAETLEVRFDAPHFGFRGGYVDVNADRLSRQGFHSRSKPRKFRVYSGIGEANIELWHCSECRFEFRPQRAGKRTTRVGTLSRGVPLRSVSALRHCVWNRNNDMAADCVAQTPSSVLPNAIRCGENHCLQPRVERWGDRNDVNGCGADDIQVRHHSPPSNGPTSVGSWRLFRSRRSPSSPSRAAAVSGVAGAAVSARSIQSKSAHASEQ